MGNANMAGTLWQEALVSMLERVTSIRVPGQINMQQKDGPRRTLKVTLRMRGRSGVAEKCANA